VKKFQLLLIKLVFILLLFTFIFNQKVTAQVVNGSNISGNLEVSAQYYTPDSAIGAPDVPESVLSNGFMNVNFNYQNFTAGIRYESYLNPILGFDKQYTGSGIPFRFASFTNENLKVTAGNFYEQFGNGLIFRSYEERSLGIDNAMDGIYASYKVTNGANFKGFVGRQRSYFEIGPGLVRGIDGDFQLNDMIKAWEAHKLRIGLGGSFVSKYQVDDSQSRILPENVGSGAGRFNLNYGNFAFDGEYAFKANDPNIVNEFIYKNGQTLLLNLAYTKKGLGARVNAKRVDNMAFHSDRNATGNNLNVNYIPAITRQYTYRLATLYPYATQPNGEMGIAGEFFYSFKPNTKLGGEYGTFINVNGSAINDIERVPTANDTLGYTSNFFAIGDTKFYQDFNFEVSKKLNKKNKLILTYLYQLYNKNQIEGKIDEKMVTSHITVAELIHKINTKKSLRIEAQHLSTEQDLGNWMMGLVEYSISPRWLFTVFDEWNYGNKKAAQRFNYYTFSSTYVKGGSRITLAYARQRAGLLCVGGVCRFVPASNGVTLTITSRF
jgi:hypothetical protein